jgi:hypothetical protein
MKTLLRSFDLFLISPENGSKTTTARSLAADQENLDALITAFILSRTKTANTKTAKASSGDQQHHNTTVTASLPLILGFLWVLACTVVRWT